MATFIWKRRGWVTATLGALIALTFIAIDIRFASPALAVSDGDPYDVPVVVDTNPDPAIIETTITAQPAAVDVGNGVIASVLTFNGSVPGPEFRLNVGDTVIVHFVNNIAHPTGIHWHGIELANASDGTPLTQNMVDPNGTFEYKFTVTRPGIYWYHPHHHSSTNQVFKGLCGSIIVTKSNEAPLIAAGVSALSTRGRSLSDITVCQAVGSDPRRITTIRQTFTCLRS
jgi:FtsP/CotA-like multicopper oxidase with cupredoxin domain